ncbi:MAG: hypothetical protein ABI823_05230 [Bryobacteraceae bacterium]
MFEIRLGDVIDDYCVKCRRLTNHSIVSIIDGAAAKVRCRTCYNDHDFRNEVVPPTKKELKKLALFNEVLAGAPGVEAEAGEAEAELEVASEVEAGGEEAASEAPAAPAKKTKSKTAKSK